VNAWGAPFKAFKSFKTFKMFKMFKPLPRSSPADAGEEEGGGLNDWNFLNDLNARRVR
jgi:hypothetical protein